MLHYQENSISQVFNKLCKDLCDSSKYLENSSDSSVNSQLTRDLGHVSFCVKNPKEFFILDERRKTNPYQTVFETIWVLSNTGLLDPLLHFIPSAKNWSDDGETWGGYYGRLFSLTGLNRKNVCVNVNQIKNVIQILTNDRNSRQAVTSIFIPTKELPVASITKDYVCNTTQYYRIINDELHFTLCNRSNDVWFGLSATNFVEFSIIQQLVAFYTNSKVGSYNFITQSMHLYERHFDKAQLVAHFEQKDSYLECEALKFPLHFDNLELLSREIVILNFDLQKELDYEFQRSIFLNEVRKIKENYQEECLDLISMMLHTLTYKRPQILKIWEDNFNYNQLPKAYLEAVKIFDKKESE